MREFRILSWKINDATTHRIMTLDEVGNVKVNNDEVYYDRKGVQRAKMVHELNETIHHWNAWNRGRISRHEFRDAVSAAFNIDVELYGESGEGKFIVPGTDDIYLAYTWYNYQVEVAYCS